MIMDRTVMADLYFSTAGDSCGASNSSIVGAWPIALLGIASILNSLGCFSMPIKRHRHNQADWPFLARIPIC